MLHPHLLRPSYVAPACTLTLGNATKSNDCLGKFPGLVKVWHFSDKFIHFGTGFLPLLLQGFYGSRTKPNTTHPEKKSRCKDMTMLAVVARLSGSFHTNRSLACVATIEHWRKVDAEFWSQCSLTFHTWSILIQFPSNSPSPSSVWRSGPLSIEQGASTSKGGRRKKSTISQGPDIKCHTDSRTVSRWHTLTVYWCTCAFLRPCLVLLFCNLHPHVMKLLSEKSTHSFVLKQCGWAPHCRVAPHCSVASHCRVASHCPN